MAAVASISAVSASFTTLSNSSTKPSSALPAFHGLKATASGASIEFASRVASQCVAAAASSAGSRGVVAMTADVATKFSTKKSEETFTAAKVKPQHFHPRAL